MVTFTAAKTITPNYYAVLASTGKYGKTIFVTASDEKEAESKARELYESPHYNKFEYMMLDRLRTDCELYLGAGERNAEYCLWGKTEQEHIAKMLEIYDFLPVKPSWLPKEQIIKYAAEMGVK